MSDWDKPYEKVFKKEETLELQSLLDQYRKLYREKYKQEIIFHPSNTHKQHLVDLRKLVGDKASQYLYEYFNMREDWFMKHNHSLKVLLDNINKISIQVEKKFQKKIESKEKRLIDYFCESCWKDIQKEVPMDFSFDGKLIRCEECEKENRSLKKPEARVLKFSLPEMPK